MPLAILKGHDFSYMQNTNLLDMYILINFDIINSYITNTPKYKLLCPYLTFYLEYFVEVKLLGPRVQPF